MTGSGDVGAERRRRCECHIVSPITQPVGERHEGQQVAEAGLRREQHSHHTIIPRTADQDS